MKLLLNAESLRPPLTGIGNYTFHLLEQYLALELFEEIHCFSGTGWHSGAEQLLISDGHRNSSESGSPSFTQASIAAVRKAIGVIPGSKATYDAVMDQRFRRFADTVSNETASTVYHETNYILKPSSGPKITTVHDLSHVRFPQYHPPEVVTRLERQLPDSLNRADLVITVSNVVREELIEHYNLDPGHVKTVYEGVDPLYKPRSQDETNAVLSRYDLFHKAYVLMVATLEPRKGIDVLLDAWELLPLELRKEMPLVLTGSSGWRNEKLRKRIDVMVEAGTVRHLGYVPAEVLPALYSGASVFSYPSVYEGFGLPVLDAMHSGVPVVCRAGTSMAEFAQGACVLCETGEAEELATRLTQLMESRAICDEWSKKGIEQSQKYSWQRCAQETAALYQTVL